ncbi:MAG: GNAT family N-acetyltransferase [Burkholderiales bacterium]|nr:GNAT family N-acetyltransferase [Burkholderiales bacterium]
MDSVVIETPRFTLRTLTIEDATEKYSRWFDDPVVAEHIVGAKTAHDIASLRDYIVQKSAHPNVLFLGIFAKATGTHIGNLKFEPIDFNACHAVLGIMVGDVRWRGRSVAGEVINAAGQWLNKTFGISELALGVAKSNVAAQKAYKKSGFIFGHRHYLQVDTATTLSMIKKVDG